MTGALPRLTHAMLRPSAALLALVTLAACRAARPARDDGDVRVALCQIAVDGDLERAFGRIDDALAQAARAGADLACFPETCLLGWLNPAAHDTASPIPGPCTDRLADLARAHGVMVAVGLAERAPGGALYDAAVLVDRDGTLLVHHRKANVLSELMDPPYTAGSGSAAWADTRLGRIGLLICADVFEERLVGALAAAQPDLVVVPFGWAAPHADWPQHGASLHAWIASTARRTGAPVVGVDAVGAVLHGPWRGFPLGGQSAVSDARGALSTPLADRAAEVRVVDVHLRR